MRDAFLKQLTLLYGEEKGKESMLQLEKLLVNSKSAIQVSMKKGWDEKDVLLITYADSFVREGESPLQSLASFLDNSLKGALTDVHILPFFPSTSDRGFSVADYTKVKAELGNWSAIEAIATNYRLMADMVLDHVSVQHEWFQKFLNGDEQYWDYFIHFDEKDIPREDLKKVVRPRSSPLLTTFATKKGDRAVWTTFSVEGHTDQVDLNYKNPEVLLEIVKVLLLYLEKGVRIIRLDAVPYIWKEIGTDCYDLPQVHTVICLLRLILDEVCPEALIVAQSSASLDVNMAYFGKQSAESQLIYNFSLPPVLLHAFHTSSSAHLNNLAGHMKAPNERSTFLNVLALHDGIGVSGAKGFLSDNELQDLYDRVQKNGGELSYRDLPDGSKAVVEVNATWWSALNDTQDPFEIQKQKFLTSYAICMALNGIPAIYYLSLFGQLNDQELFKKTGIRRDLNRSQYNLDELKAQLEKTDSKATIILADMLKLIGERKKNPLLHPRMNLEVLDLDARVFAVVRSDGSHQFLALHNLSGETVEVSRAGNNFTLKPYSYHWEQF